MGNELGQWATFLRLSRAQEQSNACYHRVEVSQRKVDLSNSRLCRKWVECIDNDPLREFERKEEVGELLE